MMLKRISSLLAAIALLSACQFDGQQNRISEYCEENPAVCVLIGIAIAGGVIALINANDDDAPIQGQAGSDIRLKHNIRHVETLENGIRLHAFQYLDDDRFFVGVLAQELVQMPQFASAVVQMEGGYLGVDYTKLGLKLANAQAMIMAGNHAIEVATAN